MEKIEPSGNAKKDDRTLWLARITVGAVFLMNVSCALAFILQPELYSPGFEVAGVPGRIYVQGLGILFLMWNATYPLVIFHPIRYRALFVVVLIQQAIGFAGETWLWLTLPAGHSPLRATGLRFIIFDGIGLITMAGAYWLLRKSKTSKSS
ncbi:MAG: hypothetical protein ACERKY_05455 [Anaerolineales bacterium]